MIRWAGFTSSRVKEKLHGIPAGYTEAGFIDDRARHRLLANGWHWRGRGCSCKVQNQCQIPHTFNFRFQTQIQTLQL